MATQEPIHAVGRQPHTAGTTGKWFSHFANRTAVLVGSPYIFFFALATIVAWLVTGPIFHFSDAWQLVINSWTNIVTFIMVFVIQNSQNRDSKAINLKLDELIHAIGRAQEEMIDIEKLSDQELEDLAKRYERIRREWDERRTGRDRQHKIA